MATSQPKALLLIADASSENVSALNKILAPDFDIQVAADGEETIKLAASNDPPELILLNDKLPGADAYGVCRRLKADRTTKDIPIILLAEPAAEDTAARGFELGAAD